MCNYVLEEGLLVEHELPQVFAYALAVALEDHDLFVDDLGVDGVGGVRVHLERAALVGDDAHLRPRIEADLGRVRRLAVQVRDDAVVRHAEVDRHSFAILQQQQQ